MDLDNMTYEELCEMRDNIQTCITKTKIRKKNELRNEHSAWIGKYLHTNSKSVNISYVKVLDVSDENDYCMHCLILDTSPYDGGLYVDELGLFCDTRYGDAYCKVYERYDECTKEEFINACKEFMKKFEVDF